ncbi:uncharacterized protein EI90DRAFT_2939123, partial [Cantharellus anzutake]|uniref:uncharacterized protein n=1 Tax=Cantharellus anzutake TaxID=1750568 RepID=UPI001907039A
GLLVISRGTSLLLLGVYIAYLIFQLKTHTGLFMPEVEGEMEEEPAQMNVVSTSVSLLAVTILTSCSADWLASIEEAADRYSIPRHFTGLVLVPFVVRSDNPLGLFTSVLMTAKGKMEMMMGLGVGSSIQVATFVIPLLVTIGWIIRHDLTLFFANLE